MHPLLLTLSTWSPLPMAPCQAHLAMRNWMSGATARRPSIWWRWPRWAHRSRLICFHTSAAERLDVGASVTLSQGGKSSTEGLHLPPDCLAQRTAMPIRVSSTYQRDLVLTHAAYASFFKQRNCLRPFSCRDGTGAGVRLAQTKAEGGIPAIPVLPQNPSYKLCCKYTAHPGEASNATR